MQQELIISDSFDCITASALVLFLLPLFSFAFLIFFRKLIPNLRGLFASTILFIAFAIAVYIFSQVWNAEAHYFRVPWFNIAGINNTFGFGILVDNISALMMVIVTFISFLVHVYSREYLKGDKKFPRYFAYLGLFTFSMLGIVIADNLLALFIYWELVGLSSYILIGFWYEKDEAVRANKKAFIVNRIGDFGFLIGILTLWTLIGTLDIHEIVNIVSTSSLDNGYWVVNDANGVIRQIPQVWLTVSGIGLFFGCVGKSAQFPLQVWLPDAMEGPTPVSALIHAATMVAAGIFLLARVFPLLDIDVLHFIAFTGAVTAFMGAFAAMAQNDIKRVLAFSTISQLGYMVMGMGVGAYSASIFHLTTHAIFKACLFLAAGAVIHSMHHVELELKKEGKNIHFDAQDMRLMGNLRKKMPLSFMAFLLAALSLSGLPLFSGFMSKDAILTGALAWSTYTDNPFAFIVPLLGFLTAIMTAFYMGRQILLVFFGDFRLANVYESAKDGFKHVIETPKMMRVPIIILSVLSVGFIFNLNPLSGEGSWLMETIKVPASVAPGAWYGSEWTDALYRISKEKHALTAIISIVLAFSGIGLAWLFYFPGKWNLKVRDIQDKYVSEGTFLNKLSLNNWYMDEVYHMTIIHPVVLLSKACAWFDKKIIDRLVDLTGIATVVKANVIAWSDRNIVDGAVHLVARISGFTGKLARSLQGGNVQQYFVITLLSLLIIFILVLL